MYFPVRVRISRQKQRLPSSTSSYMGSYQNVWPGLWMGPSTSDNPIKKTPHRCARCFGFSWFQMQSDWQPRLDIHKQEPLLWPSLAWPPHFPSLLLSQSHRQDGGVAVWPAEVSCWTEQCLVVTWGNYRGDWEWERPGTHRGVSKGLMSGAWGWSRIPWRKTRTWHKRWLSPGVTGARKPSTLRHDKREVHIRRC